MPPAPCSITYNGRKWEVERRYSEFDDLDKELLRIYGRDSAVRILVLPSKVPLPPSCMHTAHRRSNFWPCLNEPKIEENRNTDCRVLLVESRSGSARCHRKSSSRGGGTSRSTSRGWSRRGRWCGSATRSVPSWSFPLAPPGSRGQAGALRAGVGARRKTRTPHLTGTATRSRAC